jgi:hypothetical protein
MLGNFLHMSEVTLMMDVKHKWYFDHCTPKEKISEKH